MSIFYDPHAKRPRIWTFLFLIILPIIIFCIVYLYGNKKAEQNAVDPQKNSLFEQTEE
jgi:preprotein translocase subunit SecY